MGGADDEDSLAAFLSLGALSALDEMSMDEFHQAVKTGDLSELVVLQRGL